MMKRILSKAALAAIMLATPATIGAQQTYTWPAYDIAYYDGPYHYSEQVGQSRGYCTDGDAGSYMEWGYQTLHEVKVKVADCPVEL